MSKPTHIDKCDCDLCRAYLIETQRVDTPMPKIKLCEIEEKANRTSYYVFKRGEPLDSMDVENLLHVVREMRKALKSHVVDIEDIDSETKIDSAVCVHSPNHTEDCTYWKAKQALDLVESDENE
jgi:hypothetical protein